MPAGTPSFKSLHVQVYVAKNDARFEPSASPVND
jgi:hypothetical protein